MGTKAGGSQTGRSDRAAATAEPALIPAPGKPGKSPGMPRAAPGHPTAQSGGCGAEEDFLRLCPGIKEIQAPACCRWDSGRAAPVGFPTGDVLK